jgi:hypothetical protein
MVIPSHSSCSSRGTFPCTQSKCSTVCPPLLSRQVRSNTDDSHRADALTSVVALTSILGSSFGGYTFLDPLGGLAVSFFILQQGLSLSKVAMLELLDAGVDKPTQKKIELLVEGLVDGKDLLGVRNVRGVKSGGTFLLIFSCFLSLSLSFFFSLFSSFLHFIPSVSLFLPNSVIWLIWQAKHISI